MDYLSWFIPAMALQFPMVVMVAALLRGTGNFKPGMVVQTATVIMNIVLAPALMFGWLGTAAHGRRGRRPWRRLSRSSSARSGWPFYFFEATSYLKLHPRFRPQAGMWRRILKIGLPAGVEFALIAVYLFVVYTVSRPFGAAAQAGFGIGQRMTQAGFMPIVALGFAVAPVAGQNFGAHRSSERVRETFKRAVMMGASVIDDNHHAHLWHFRRRGADSLFLVRPWRHRRRLQVLAHHRLGDNPVRHHLRQRQHVSGRSATPSPR